MESITYPYRDNTLGLIAGLMLLCLALLLLCLFVMLSGLLLLNLSNAPAAPRSLQTGLALAGMGGFGLLLAVVGGAAVYASRRKMEAILTSETFTYGPRGRSTTIRLADITRITAKTWYWSEDLDWVVTIESAAGQKISFAPRSLLFRRPYWSRFDYQAILRDLLPRLPVTAQVDVSVSDYAADIVHSKPAGVQ